MSIRIGQISGSLPNGSWPTTDWVPILAKSSIALDMFPRAIGTISWIPPAVVAQVFVDAALAETLPSGILNVTHPKPIEWNVMAEWMANSLTSSPLAIVPFEHWIAELQRLAGKDSEQYTGIVSATTRLRFSLLRSSSPL